MAVDYVAHANELSNLSQEEMASKFNRELSQAVRGMEQPSQVAQQFVELHERHAKTVMEVLQSRISFHSPKLVSGSLPSSSMIVLVAGQKHLTKYWRRLADTIIHHLQCGLPVACQSEKPKNELRLQEICDGILQAQSEVLQREFPLDMFPNSLKRARSSKGLRQLRGGHLQNYLCGCGREQLGCESA